MMVRLAKALPLAAAVLVLSLLPAAPADASFGFQSAGIGIVNSDRSPDIQAGSHPFEMTTSFAFNTRTNILGQTVPEVDVRDVEVELPPGLIGDPSATPKCTPKQFRTPSAEISANPYSGSSCPGNTQVGVAQFALTLGLRAVPLYFGVYNLVPPAGVPAAFGFNPAGLEVTLLPKVRTGGDYGVTAHVDNVSQLQPFLSSSVTFWGVPGEHSHDKYRGECLAGTGESLCEEPSNVGGKPFLRLPTSCPDEPLTMPIRADSWTQPGNFIEEDPFNSDSEGHPAMLSGCGNLDFSPSLSVTPQSHAASSPTAVAVDLHMPQNENPAGLGEADLRNATVALPAGLAVNPSAVDGLAACSPEKIAIDNATEPSCPEDSKIGTVEVVSPLLEEPLEGAVYQAAQTNNPFGSLFAFYIVAQGQGVTVKLPGKVTADPLTGQLTTTVKNAPQLPFTDFKLNFFGGPHAALMTPGCGTYAASASLASWAGGAPVSPAIQPFAITDGCGGGFAPSFVGGTVNNQAGGFSPLAVELSRTDQDQNFGQVSVHTPPGLLAMLSKVTLCGEPQAALGTCPASSQIGHVTVRAGAGPRPVQLPQPGRQEDPVYLTGPYKGAPFGLAIVGHAEAGPFNLGDLIVRSAIYIDPHTAQVTVVSDPLPRILQGVPLDIRTVTVTVDRAGPAANEFTFNPTNCEPLAVNGTIASTLGAGANVSTRFQAANCASLPFKPKFTVSTQGQASKKNGASLDVKVSSGPGQANIGKAVVSLPKQLPARLTTLQQACPEATFAANPATCPAGSNVGAAKAVTPVLSAPLAGPAYLVSHGGAAFPDLVVILQGQGIRLDLVGGTSIKKGITTSSFTSVPDAPLTRFELKLPTGPHSALTTNLPAAARGNLCGSKLVMPTTITGQNGAQVKQSTKIAIGGCPKARARKAGRGR
jgi:hypothetical protein